MPAQEAASVEEAEEVEEAEIMVVAAATAEMGETVISEAP